MKNKTKALITLATATVVLLAYFTYRRLHERPLNPLRMTNAELLSERTERVRRWLSEPTVPLSSPSLSTALDRLLNADQCFAAPPNGSAIPLKELTEKQVTDLKKAIADMLGAYGASKSDAVFEYMSERGEKLSPFAATNIKTDLVKSYQLQKSVVETMSEKQLFGEFWARMMKCETHWSSLVENSGCARIWKTSKGLDDSMISSLGNENRAIFSNMVRFTHIFQSISPSIQSILAKKREVIFADIKVVIQHDQSRLNEPAPYYIRFWLDPVGGRWHPLDLVLITTANSNYPDLLF